MMPRYINLQFTYVFTDLYTFPLAQLNDTAPFTLQYSQLCLLLQWWLVCVCLWQVAGLRRQLVVGRDAAMEEVQLRNKFLSDKLERLEQEFASCQPTGVSPVCHTLIQLTSCLICW